MLYDDSAIAMLTLVDGAARRFWFDVRWLPPTTQAARRTVARNRISDYVRAAMAKQNVTGVAAGDLLGIATDADGWRAV